MPSSPDSTAESSHVLERLSAGEVGADEVFGAHEANLLSIALFGLGCPSNILDPHLVVRR